MGRPTTNENRERVCLYLDKDIVAHFKHLASTEERPYQPLMNKVLRDYLDALPIEQRYHNR